MHSAHTASSRQIGRQPSARGSTLLHTSSRSTPSRSRTGRITCSNEVAWHPDGWRASFRNNDACGTCGEPCKRAALPEADGTVVYVGDGYSDRCAAQAADRVFARRALARYLDERGVAYEPFEDFYDIERALNS